MNLIADLATDYLAALTAWAWLLPVLAGEIAAGIAVLIWVRRGGGWYVQSADAAASGAELFADAGPRRVTKRGARRDARALAAVQPDQRHVVMPYRFKTSQR